MRAYKTEGIVIKRISLAEADRIITVYSQKFGKIKIKAKGVRRITSRRSSHIELLNHSVFSLYRGNSLPILTEVEALETFQDLKKDLKKIGLAYHICELVDSLCAENQENSRIFDLLKATLIQVSLMENEEIIVKKFELELLNLLGFYGIEEKEDFDAHSFIENILERKLKAKQIAVSFS